MKTRGIWDVVPLRLSNLSRQEADSIIDFSREISLILPILCNPALLHLQPGPASTLCREDSLSPASGTSSSSVGPEGAVHCRSEACKLLLV